MSVIASSARKPRRWLHLWPLALFIVGRVRRAVVMAGWPQVMMKSILWQRDVNQQMSGLLKAVADNPTKAGGSLLAFSFVYGVLHALGPGHGKIVITTACHASLEAEIEHRSDTGLFAAAGRRRYRAGSGRPLAVTASRSSAAPEQFLAGEVMRWWACWGDPLLAGAEKLRVLLQKPTFKSFTPHHVHDAHCGCGHQHLPTQAQLQSGDDWRARVMIVLSMGMRPCSGAIMVLLFSKVIGVFGWGMLSALAMAAGTSLTISSLALLVHSFRQLAVKLSGNKTPVLWRQVGWTTLALAGGVILLVAAVTMWMSAVPVGRDYGRFSRVRSDALT